MKSSTLNPGKVPNKIRKLREAAMKELNSPADGEKKAPKVKFDHDHKKTPPNDKSTTDFDRDNGVAQYPGQNVEHIGNGSGGVR